MKKLLLILPLLIVACTRIAKLDDAAEFSTEFYTPAYANGFELRSLTDDTTRLLLEVYRPDTMSIIIPQGGFRSVMCMSSTYVGALSTLGTPERVVAVSRRDYITDPQVKASAVEIGHDGAMDYEALLSVKPEIAFIYGIGGPSPIEGKLKELCIPYVYINDFEEQNPLGRAEWMVALGALTGTDGKSRFKTIVEQYEPISGHVKVMLNSPYGGTWFIPGKENYMSRLLHDAGAEIAVRQTEGVTSGTIDIEEALPALEQADLWLSPGQVSSLRELKAHVSRASFKGPVWNQTQDFYESGASRPDMVLNELKQIVDNTAPDSLRYFYRLR